MIEGILLWLTSVLIQTGTTVFFYTKVSRAKFDFRFAFFCFVLFLLAPFLSAIHDLVYYGVSFIQPFCFACYFQAFRLYKPHLNLFLSLFVYLAIETSDTFFSVIISSVTGDVFVQQFWNLFYILIYILSLIIMLKALDVFGFDFLYFQKEIFIDKIKQVTSALFCTHLLLIFSHFISGIKHFNSFGSILSTICFLFFLSTLFYLQSIRKKQEKEEQLKQKEKEQLQLQEYTDEIVSLYNEIRGFRHDYGGMLASLQAGINTGDLKEVKRIYNAVLVNANLKLRSDKYTYFELNNVKDMALKSVMTDALFKARDQKLTLIFEVKDEIDRLPVTLLDLVRIASILLNNAIEGAHESFKKTIRISLVQLEEETIFIVQNSRKIMELDLDKIYQRGFSTKGADHGIGLATVKKIIDSYDNIMLNTEIETEYFTQVVTFRRKDLT